MDDLTKAEAKELIAVYEKLIAAMRPLGPGATVEQVQHILTDQEKALLDLESEGDQAEPALLAARLRATNVATAALRSELESAQGLDALAIVELINLLVDTGFSIATAIEEDPDTDIQIQYQKL